MSGNNKSSGMSGGGNAGKAPSGSGAGGHVSGSGATKGGTMKAPGQGSGLDIAENEKIKTGVVAAAAIGAVALVAWGAYALFTDSDSGSSSSRKTMKAPGRGHRIFRDDFDKDPASYFRKLRGKE